MERRVTELAARFGLAELAEKHGLAELAFGISPEEIARLVGLESSGSEVTPTRGTDEHRKHPSRTDSTGVQGDEWIYGQVPSGPSGFMKRITSIVRGGIRTSSSKCYHDNKKG